MASTTLQSEVTGTVWKVEVRPGDSVSAEQPLVVLESMKMEIPVPAPVACKVIEVLVAEGDAVTEGDVIAHIEG